MYNKIFTKILDSSVWMESDATRIVWITFLAAMDEEGFVQFASTKNVAHRACVSIEDAQQAVARLEAPDPDSGDPDNDGRRVEKVDSGWVVLNSEKYRSVATREHQKALNRERVRRHRAKGECNAPVMEANESVTPSEAEAEAKAELIEVAKPKAAKAAALSDDEFFLDLETDAAYSHVNIKDEWAKMARWCVVNKKQATRRRFINWINRIDKPIDGPSGRGEFRNAF